MNKIKELRKERGWKQSQLGQLLNVKTAAVSKYENGYIPLTTETINILCDIFDVSADYIIGRTEKKLPDTELPVSGEIQALIDERQAARKAKNFARADEIRDILKEKGITLKDTPQGVQIIRA